MKMVEHPAPKLDAYTLIDELRTSEARFRAACECAPLGIYISEVGRGVIYVNPGMQRIPNFIDTA